MLVLERKVFKCVSGMWPRATRPRMQNTNFKDRGRVARDHTRSLKGALGNTIAYQVLYAVPSLAVWLAPLCTSLIPGSC